MSTNKPEDNPENYSSVPLIGTLVDKLTPKLGSILNDKYYNTLNHFLVKLAHYLLLATAISILIFSIVCSVQRGGPEYVLLGLGYLFLLPTLLYISNKFIQSNLLLLKSTPSYISGNLLPNVVSILSLVIGVVLAAYYLNRAIDLDQYLDYCISVFILLVAWSVSIYARNIKLLYISVNPAASAGGEALGILSLFIRISYRIVPLLFSLMVIYGVMEIFIDLYMKLPSPIIDEVAQEIMKPSAMLLLFTAIPIIAYLVFSLSYLVIDLLRTILSLRKDQAE